MEDLIRELYMHMALAGALPPLIGALIGFCGAIVGAILGVVLKERHDRKKRNKDSLFQAYMLLQELSSYYWWEVVAEIRKQPIDLQRQGKIGRLAYRISDALRTANDQNIVKEILEVLFSKDPGLYPSALKRKEALSAVIRKLGEGVNPVHAKAMEDISRTNERVMMERFKDGISIPQPIQDNDPGGFTWL